MAKINDFLRSIGMEDPMPYQDIVSNSVGRIFRAYCSSVLCSDGEKLVLKATVRSHKRKVVVHDDGYQTKPVYCPDCGSALFWRACRVGESKPSSP